MQHNPDSHKSIFSKGACLDSFLKGFTSFSNPWLKLGSSNEFTSLESFELDVKNISKDFDQSLTLYCTMILKDQKINTHYAETIKKISAQTLQIKSNK